MLMSCRCVAEIEDAVLGKAEVHSTLCCRLFVSALSAPFAIQSHYTMKHASRRVPRSGCGSVPGNVWHRHDEKMCKTRALRSRNREGGSLRAACCCSPKATPPAKSHHTISTPVHRWIDRGGTSDHVGLAALVDSMSSRMRIEQPALRRAKKMRCQTLA
ncbi:hypothetical protein DOTSEDRAFT_72029 [Dothistroma septosporum NZE10]|uniref:Uncharacterized protein n=1 Tax=Dothistroma septosporum (strain NZE10 / CBS 128990) TaxID=675120 RepID=N1PPU6_DOTSN|nr:hypothetical protein DOTSEDRAFT_72029 [Dothistroma septosporum NZE10]